MHPALLNVQVDRDVLYLTLNRPAKHNALSTALLTELHEAFSLYRDDPTLKAAVVTGAGEQSFAAGGDLKEFDSIRSADQVLTMRATAMAALDAVRNFPVPVVAALNGDARGGGAELALACDLRIAAGHTKIGFIQSRLAITPAWGGGVDLLELLGSAKGLRLMASGDLLTAETALELGLLEAVAAPDQAISEFIEDFLEPLRRLTPLVARGLKTLSAAAKRGASREELLALEAQSLVDTWVHDDHWEAVSRAFKPGS